jgi:putative ABC transport system permease protein
MNSFFEGFVIALRGLSANKIRAALTMLGIIIGVAAVIALVSIGQGFSAFMTERLSGLGTTTLTIMTERRVSNAVSLTTADAEALADPLTCPGVEAVAPIFQGSGDVTYAGSSAQPSIYGVTPPYEAVQNYEMQMGKFITDSDVQRKTRVAVLGSTTYEDLFPNGSYPIGETIRIGDVTFDIIGVLAEKGSTGFEDSDDVVLIPLTTAQTRLFTAETVRGEYVVGNIKVLVKSDEWMDQTVDDITEVLRERHHLTDDEVDDFRVMDPSELIETTTEITGTLTIFLGAIAAISLLVGGIGIMNIMLVSVTERTREIGLRKAVGAGKRDILWQFLIEAMVLSLMGGLIGIGAGAAISRVVGPLLNVTTYVSPESVMLSVGFSVAVGLFFGIYPAMRAANLRPIDALRYE